MAQRKQTPTPPVLFAGEYYIEGTGTWYPGFLNDSNEVKEFLKTTSFSHVERYLNAHSWSKEETADGGLFFNMSRVLQEKHPEFCATLVHPVIDFTKSEAQSIILHVERDGKSYLKSNFIVITNTLSKEQLEKMIK